MVPSCLSGVQAPETVESCRLRQGRTDQLDSLGDGTDSQTMSPTGSPSSGSGLGPRQTQRGRARVDRKKGPSRSMGYSNRHLGLGTQAETGTSSSRQTRGNLGAKLNLRDQNWDARSNADHLNIELGSFKKPLIEVRLGPRTWGRAEVAGGAQGLLL